MNEPQAARWLIDQLPKLVAQGVVSKGAADSLRAHYAGVARSGVSSRNVMVVVFSVLGGLLVSGGIILLFAHNWEQLGRPARTVLSFLPLAIGVVLSTIVVLRKNQSTAVAEGVGAFHSVAIGACIALISQTYQLSGSFPAFILTWALLALPLVYLLRATSVAILYVAGITTWGADSIIQRDSMLWFWPLLILVLPHYWLLIRENRFSTRAWWMSLALALAIPVSAGIQCDRTVFALWPLVFSGVFTSLYLAGCIWFRKTEAPRLAHPFVWVGQLGIVVLAILLSYRIAWEHLFSAVDFKPVPSAVAANVINYSFLVSAITLLAVALRCGTRFNLAAGLLPAAVLCGTFLLRINTGSTLILMNLYALGLGIVTIIRGTRDLRFTTMNAGLLLVATLIISRFFDSEVNFLLKGVAFIVVGAGLGGANIFLLKRRGRTQ